MQLTDQQSISFTLTVTDAKLKQQRKHAGKIKLLTETIQKCHLYWYALHKSIIVRETLSQMRRASVSIDEMYIHTNEKIFINKTNIEWCYRSSINSY